MVDESIVSGISSSVVSSANSVASIMSCNPTGAGLGLDDNAGGKEAGVANEKTGVVAELDEEAVRPLLVSESGGGVDSFAIGLVNKLPFEVGIRTGVGWKSESMIV